MKKIKILTVILYVCVSFPIVTFAIAETRSTDYSYDDLGRLKISENTGYSKTTYDYDAADNRTNKNVQLLLPPGAVTISDLYVPNKLVDGTSSYKLRADGYIEITQGETFPYAGQISYAQTTTATHRWLAAGINPARASITGALANPSGVYTSCTSGMFSNIHGGYAPSWSMTTVQQTGTKKCRIHIQIRDAANPGIVLDSAYIVLSAGPAS